MQKAHVLTILDPLLAAVARLMVARGVPFGDFADRMKVHFLHAALRDAGAAATDSRLSLLTGLQRRDVARLRGLEAAEAPRVNHLARLVAIWGGDPDYRGADLPRRGAAPSFEALAARVRRDVHPRSLADQLVAAGSVAELDDDRLRLLRPWYQPLAGSEAQLEYLARNVGDHLEAAVGNVTAESPPHLERAVHYSHLSAETVADLDAVWRSRIEAALLEVNRRALALQGQGTKRFRAGAYFYSEEGE